MRKTFFSAVLSVIALVGLVFEAEGKTASMGYKIGDVVAAEFTSAAVDIIGRESSPYPNNYAAPRYVQVVVKMHPRRSIGTVDYSLTINNVTANCIAMASNQEPFVSSATVLSPEPKDAVKLIFVFDGKRVRGPGKNKVLRGVLRSNLRGRGNVSIAVTDLGNGAFTDTEKIPAAGLLK